MSHVPKFLWLVIGDYLSVGSILRLEQTCKFLRGVFADESFWKRRCFAMKEDEFVIQLDKGYRDQLLDFIRFRPPANGKDDAHLLRILMIGPGAPDVAEQLIVDWKCKVQHADFGWQMYGSVLSGFARRVGLVRKTFELIVVHAKDAKDLAKRCNGKENVVTSMIDAFVFVEGAQSSRDQFLEAYKVLDQKLTPCLLVCGPGQGESDPKLAYPLQESLVQKLEARKAQLLQLDPDAVLPKIPFHRPGVPYACSANSGDVLRAILLEFLFRLDGNTALGKMIAMIGQAKRKNGITDQVEVKEEEPKHEEKCHIC